VPKGAAAPSIAGTTWSGDGIVAPTATPSRADGSMSYSYNGATYLNGHWKQDGAKIHWDATTSIASSKALSTATRFAAKPGTSKISAKS